MARPRVTHSGHGSGRPQDGNRILQFAAVWLNMVLFDGKTIEVRGFNARHGHTWLGRNGFISGRAELTCTRHVHDMETFQDAFSEHFVTLTEGVDGPVLHKATWFWTLSGFALLKSPMPYNVKSGPVAWAKYEKAKRSW